MKYVSVLLLAALCCLNPALAADKHSAPHAKTNVKPPTEQDQKEVKRIAVGYLIALQQLKPDLMAEVMSPELNKQTSFINRENGKTVIRPTTYEQMLEFAKTWNAKGDKFPKDPSNRVTILDMQGTMASVKLESDRWYEYLHLAKIDGQWKILNLYWQNHPDRKR
ncbi:MAG: nuclear transport factor 2 family protein [Algicola sp.]|nr:nuclear transport factor 2 family protein [Algicola sp.]